MSSGNILSNKLRRIGFFDFCETLVSFQTADAYVDFVRKTEGNFRMRIINSILIFLGKVRILQLFNKFFPGISLEKRLKLLQLRGLKHSRLSNLATQYYRTMIKPVLIGEVIREMQDLKEQNYEICIVSAGYSIYLKQFAEEFGIQHIISSEIAFDNKMSVCRGTIDGKDCTNIEKVNRIKTYFFGQSINYEGCISFSDSITDLPMLKLTGKGVVVSKNKPQQWSSKYKFKEIIWSSR